MGEKGSRGGLFVEVGLNMEEVGGSDSGEEIENMAEGMVAENKESGCQRRRK